MDIPQIIQQRVSDSITTWYPNAKTQSPGRLIESKTFRWSEHYIFQVDFQSQPSKQILAKRLVDTSDGQLSQDDHVRQAGSSRQEFEALSAIYQEIQKANRDTLTAVRPLAYYEDLNTVVLEFLPGKHLLSLLQEAATPLASQAQQQLAKQSARRAGQILALLHGISKQGYPQPQAISPEEFAQTSSERIRRLSELDPNIDSPSWLIEASRQFERSLATVPQQTTFAHLHGDYYPNNLVTLPTGTVFTIDTTLHYPGPIEQDLAKFIAGVGATKRQILLGSPFFRASLATNVCEEFSSGYLGTSNYNTGLLKAFTFQAYLQRWIEVLEVVQSSVLSKIGPLVKRTRVTPVFRKKIQEIAATSEQETI